MLYCLRDKYPEIFMHEGDRKLNFGDILACVPFQIDEEDNIE